MNLRVLALVLCLVGGPIAAAAVGQGARAAAPAATPVAIVERFHAAMARGDAEAVAALLAEDAVIYEQGGAEASKAEYLSGHLPGDIAYSAGMIDTITGRRSAVAGEMAVVMTQGRTTGAYDGKPVDRMTTETMVLSRIGGEWLITHIHWSSRVAKR